MPLSLLRAEELDLCLAQLAECVAQQQSHISNNESPPFQPNEANSEAVNQWWGVRNLAVPHSQMTRVVPALQTSMLAEWICNIEAVCTAWRDIARQEGGSCEAMWRRLCEDEFPMEAEPSRENYIKWRRAHLDRPRDLTPPPADLTIPSRGDYKLVFVFRQLSAPEDENGGPIHFRTSRVVHHFERPLAYGLNVAFGEAAILPIDEGAHFGARCPVNPIPADISHYGEEVGCDPGGVTHSISADVFLKRPDGKIAHLHHAGPFSLVRCGRRGSRSYLMMKCDTLLHNNPYLANSISHLYPRVPVKIGHADYLRGIIYERMMVVPRLSFDMMYDTPASGVGKVDTAWIDVVCFSWKVIQTWGDPADPGAAFLLRPGQSDDPAVRTLQDGLPAAGGLEWR